MKITRVESIILSCKLEEPIFHASGSISNRAAVIVKVYTDEGIIGFGESSAWGGKPSTTKFVIENELAPYIIGEDPFDTNKIWEKMYLGTREHGRKGILIAAISGIDVALWDIKGKVTNLPIYKLLGGFCDKVRVYASGGYYAKSKGPEDLAEEMYGYVKEGFTAVKMKIGLVSMDEDEKRVKAVREAITDKIDLIVDANSSYQSHRAIRMSKKLEKYDIFWLEEPVSPDDIQGYIRVRSATNIPIAAGENEYTRYGFRDLITNNAIDIIQPDVTWCGGITEVQKISGMASAWNISCAPHAFNSALTIMANAHMVASIPNGLIVEFDKTFNPLVDELLEEPIKIEKGGYIKIPNKPGLGITLNEKTIEKYLVR